MVILSRHKQQNNMVIDIHTHVFPPRVAPLAIKNLSDAGNAIYYFDGTIDGLIENMKKNDIDISVCMPVITNPRHTISINDYAILINNSYDNIYSFGGMHPEYIDYENEIKRLRENGIRGIKLHPCYQRCNIRDEKYIKIINCAIRNGMYVLIHAGLDPAFPGDESSSASNISMMLDMVEDSSKIILAHLGGLFEFENIYDKIIGKNVYLDCAMTLGESVGRDGTITPLVSLEDFKKIVIKHGSDKILAGSDNPWTDSAKIHEFFDKLDISKEDKDNILFKNAMKVLNLR